MKILVVGSGGQLGKDMVIHLSSAGHEVISIDFPAIDISKIDSVTAIVNTSKPDMIVNCAAYTAVDNCETQAETAFAINATGAENLANAAESQGAKLIHFSTDYVFDGKATSPYIETDIPNPLTVYGKSKLEGERKIAASMERFQIHRIAWLYGLYGNNFVKTIVNNAPKKIQNKEPFKVVNDQFGTPTSTVEVCRQTIELIDKEVYGIFHSTCEGACTWFDFTREIIKTYGLGVDVVPCTTEEYPRPAPRPHYSVLENSVLKSHNLNIMNDWKISFYNFYLTDKK